MLSKNWLHIETTNRCTLKCPACPRTVWQNLLGQPIQKADLDLDDFKKFLECESMEKIDTFVLCGDYGDTIYYPHLFKMIKMFREKAIHIHTNGSYKSKEWWTELNKLLTEKDVVIFGIDGLPKESNKYRVNQDGVKLFNIMKMAASMDIDTVWQYLVFDYTIF